MFLLRTCLFEERHEVPSGAVFQDKPQVVGRLVPGEELEKVGVI